MQNKEDFDKLFEAYHSMYATIEEKKKLDPVGDADADIDNDGDVDDSDDYLHNRRKAIKKSMKKEGIEDLFSDSELDKLIEMGVFEAADRAKHTKGATSPEGIMDKESPKSKQFAADHKKSDKEIEDKVYKAHDDSRKAGAPALNQSPARRADNLSNGDGKTPPKVSKGY